MLRILKQKMEDSNSNNQTSINNNLESTSQSEMPIIILIRKIITIKETNKNTSPFITIFKSIFLNKLTYEYTYNINDTFIHNLLTKMKIIFKITDRIIFGRKSFEKYVYFTVDKFANNYFLKKIKENGYTIFSFWKIYIKNISQKITTLEDLNFYDENNKKMKLSKIKI